MDSSTALKFSLLSCRIIAVKYVAIIEKSDTGFGAYVPDLPGCIAVAKTEAEVKELIEEAVAFHIEGLRKAGEQVPLPSSTSIFVDVKAA